MTVHLGGPLSSSLREVVAHQSPAHQVGQQVAEGGACGRAEADGEERQRKWEEKTRDDGQENGAGDSEGLQKDVDAYEASKHLECF